MEFLTVFNACEAALWLGLAVLMGVRRMSGMTPKLRIQLVVCFGLFGVSDLIEMQTGAFWRPLPLLFFKIVCLAGIVLGLRELARNRSSGRAAH